MNEEIRNQLRIKKVREMKNPTIVMNNEDFDDFKKELESKMFNFKVGVNPKYEGIPIITRDIIERGNIIIYDNPIN